MLQPRDVKKVETSSPPTSEGTSSSTPLVTIFKDLSATSDEVNKVLAATSDEVNLSPTPPTPTIFEMLRKIVQPPEEPVRKRAKVPLILDHAAAFGSNEPETPSQNTSKWKPLELFNSSFNTFMLPPQPVPDLLTDEELVRMKGPSRLIGFLVDIAMNERARRALRWTGTGLEFILVDKELVARMWGNRKHNTKEMNYYKLSRAIREKYEKKEKDIITKTGKLKKGSRTYSYVFTENAHPDLMGETKRTIDYIQNFAIEIGNKYRDMNDIHSNSPQAPSPQNSDE